MPECQIPSDHVNPGRARALIGGCSHEPFQMQERKGGRTFGFSATCSPAVSMRRLQQRYSAPVRQVCVSTVSVKHGPARGAEPERQ